MTPIAFMKTLINFVNPLGSEPRPYVDATGDEGIRGWGVKSSFDKSIPGGVQLEFFLIENYHQIGSLHSNF